MTNSAKKNNLAGFRLAISFILVIAATTAYCQKHVVVRLYSNKAPGSEEWKQQEKTFQDPQSGEHFAYNVTNPTLTVFRPAAGKANGTAVIVCPGGAFHVLSMDNEGFRVGQWLSKRGITAFVLKYRLAESKTDEPLKELGAKMSNFKQLDAENAPVVPLAIEDGKLAVSYVRTHAKEYGVKTNRIGIMGFSAGGTVTAGVTFNYIAESRPDFAAPVYAYLDALGPLSVRADAPPLFIAAATDDELGFAPQSVRLYNYWLAAKKPAELHIFSKGGHGFGIRKRNIPVDHWIELFGNWLKLQGYLTK